jgi:ABC-type Zn uptake system ZnuABC Zn-binding protein ZnuA
MTRRSHPGRRAAATVAAVAAALAVGVAFAPAASFAKDAGGKTPDEVLFNPKDRQALHDYRMSMDTANKCYEAWKKLVDEADKNPAIKKEMATKDDDDSDVHSIDDMIKLAETKAPVSSAFLKQNDCPLRDTVMMFMESTAIEVAGFMKKMGKEDKDFDFIAPENAAFYEKNGPQLKKYVQDIQALHKAKFPEQYKDDSDDTPDDDSPTPNGGDE